ncbi:MAG: ABC transporter permease [Anaerolineae bacterium]|nr:ABC transporter permease [Anaerolineae bacterium]
MTTQTSSRAPGEAKRGFGGLPHWVATLAPVWTLLALFIFFGVASQSFLRPQNINNILVQVSTLAIFGTGMTFVLLTGEIDLGISSTAAISGMVAAQLFANNNAQEPVPLIAGLLVGTLLGLLAGITSTRFRIPTFMSTLAVSFIGAGLTTYVSKGRTITTLPEYARFLGSGRIFTDETGRGGFPFIVIVAAIVMLIAYLVLRYTRFGRYVYMTGASKSAARLAGVNTNMILIAVLTISGFTAGLAGVVGMGRLGSAQPDPVPSYLLDTISAVVLGGTALTGGRGGILQTVIGLLIYGTLRNGLDNIPEIDIYLKEFITGVVLIVALIVNVVFAGRSARDKTAV